MKQTVILKNKLFLYLTEFFAGMSVMAVELGASRLLAPVSYTHLIYTRMELLVVIIILIDCFI